jgi:hypothetical protein
LPLGVKPFNSSSGSGKNWNRSAGMSSDSALELISGVSFAVAPSASSKCPANAEVDGASPR